MVLWVLGDDDDVFMVRVESLLGLYIYVFLEKNGKRKEGLF